MRDVRQAAGLSLRELERRSGVSRALLSRIENGRYLPRGTELVAIENALDTRFRVAVGLLEEGGL